MGQQKLKINLKIENKVMIICQLSLFAKKCNQQVGLSLSCITSFCVQQKQINLRKSVNKSSIDKNETNDLFKCF